MNAVHLKQVKFHARHGLYNGEADTGGDFEVQLSVWYEQAGSITQINQTIDYTVLYQLLQQQMQQRQDLLETIADQLCAAIHQEFPFVKEIVVEIDKLHPPIAGFEGRTGITCKRNFS